MSSRRAFGMLAIVVVVSLLLGVASLAQAAPNFNPGVIPPQAHAYGMTYGEWGAVWWQWVLGIPAPINPLPDPTGEFAAVGQSGPLFFLVGTSGGSAERTCQVPAGKGLFFPVINFADVADFATVEETLAMLDWWQSHITDMWCTVDGVELQDLVRYRGAAGFVGGLDFPENNIWGIPSGNYSPGASDGYWIMLAPPPVGNHVIQFGGSIGAVDWSQIGLPWGVWPPWSVSVRYNLTVVPRTP